MYEIKRITVFSGAKIGALLGVFLVIVLFIVLFMVQFFFSGYYSGPSFNEFSQLMMVIVFSVVGGFFGGGLWALIYNLIAEHIGGIEMEIILKEDKK